MPADTSLRAQSTRSLTPPAPSAHAETTNRERAFGFDELFFSTTDKKAIIGSGNGVFTRVSGYPLEQLVGRAHNIVRHPDMPRSVFKLFWERLEAGGAIAAYVKNRAADGSYYWVLATVDQAAGGYLSLRLKPSSPLFDAAGAIYADVLAVERKVEGGDVKRRKQAIEAGAERLLELLAEAGYPDYESFMFAALPAEVAARDAKLGESALARLGGDEGVPATTLGAILDATCGAHELLDGLTEQLEHYAALHDRLAPKIAYVNQLADNIRLFSLNALLSATRLGARGAALGAVADIMGARSHTAGPITQALAADIGGAVSVLSRLDYRIAVSKLQTEMMLVFVRELLEDGHGPGEHRADLEALAGSLDRGVRKLCDSLSKLNVHIAGVAGQAARLSAELRVLSRLEINGRIEAARLSDAESVRDLFRTIGEQVETAHEQLADFADVQAANAGSGADAAPALLAALDEVEAAVAALSE